MVKASIHWTGSFVIQSIIYWFDWRKELSTHKDKIVSKKIHGWAEKWSLSGDHLETHLFTNVWIQKSIKKLINALYLWTASTIQYLHRDSWNEANSFPRVLCEASNCFTRVRWVFLLHRDSNTSETHQNKLGLIL